MIYLLQLIQRVWCFFNRHHYYVGEELTKSHKKICCAFCDKTWLMDDDVKMLVPCSTAEIEEVKRQITMFES